MIKNLTPFVLRTSDTEWIKRNGGQIGHDERIIVQVPADEVETITFAGRDWIRHCFADCPRDAGNPNIACLTSWL